MSSQRCFYLCCLVGWLTDLIFINKLLITTGRSVPPRKHHNTWRQDYCSQFPQTDREERGWIPELKTPCLEGFGITLLLFLILIGSKICVQVVRTFCNILTFQNLKGGDVELQIWYIPNNITVTPQILLATLCSGNLNEGILPTFVRKVGKEVFADHPFLPLWFFPCEKVVERMSL